MEKFTEKKLVSIIMPCYNASRFLAESVSCVLNQTYPEIELIVVDDGSTDGSLTILRDMEKECEKIRVYTQENRGAGAARNVALKRAHGKYVAFLDADDLWDPNFLKKMIAKIEETSADLVYCGWQNLGRSGGQARPYIPPDYSNENICEVFLGGCPWPIHAALTRNRVINELGGFNERWTSCMDYDLWLRLGAHYQIALLPEILSFYRHHDGIQITKNAARIALNHWLVQKEFLSTRPALRRKLGREKIRALTDGELLHRGFICYWRRDLVSARKIFRRVMKTGYGKPNDWLYMLPSLLPLASQTFLIRFLEKKSCTH